MSVSSTIHDVFGRFQNLNLLALLHDLRSNRAARGAWSDNVDLCPIAHGLMAGRQVAELNVLLEIADVRKGCDYAARHLGADPMAVARFVRYWDEQVFGREWLYRQLEDMWRERLADAVAVQEVLESSTLVST